MTPAMTDEEMRKLCAGIYMNGTEMVYDEKNVDYNRVSNYHSLDWKTREDTD